VGLRKLTMQDPEYDEEGRLLDCVDEVAEKKDAKRVMVPYDFIESILPLVGLFVIMEAFFGGVRSIRNSYDTQGFRRVQAQFKFNAQFRYWIIFYYPAQIHIFKAFRYINIASNDPRDQGQIIAAIACQALIFSVLGIIVFKTFKAIRYGFDHEKLLRQDSTLFFEFHKDYKRGLLYYPVTFIVRFLMAFFIAFLPNPASRFPVLFIIQICVSFVYLLVLRIHSPFHCVQTQT